MGIASSIARKHYNNAVKIHSLTKMIVEHKMSQDKSSAEKKLLEHRRSNSELIALKDEISNLIDSKGADFLKNL
jgi:hypothetical protein